ncbi:hypothetical protein JXVLWARM_CDS_0065 [Burkholderia phage Bm1]
MTAAHVLLSLFGLSVVAAVCACFRPVRLLVLLAAVCLLAACAPAPVTVDRPVNVEVPVAVPCKVPPVAVPDWPLASLPKDATDYEFYQAALTEILLRKGYEERLLAAQEACKPS